MPWKGVTVTEQRTNFIRDYHKGYYSITELAERFCISRKTAYKWIDRFELRGQEGLKDQSTRPKTCPSKTNKNIEEELIELRKKHMTWGPDKLLAKLKRKYPRKKLPARSTVASIISRNNLIKKRRKRRRNLHHPGCPSQIINGPNDVWGQIIKDNSD